MRTFTTRIGLISALAQAVALVSLSVDPVVPKRRHTVLILDCSGSMAPYISDLRVNAVQYIERLPEDEFVSLVIFSGHGSSKQIAGPTQANTSGREMLTRAIQNEVKVYGTTVFSEPLTKTVEAVERLAGSDTVHNAVLFTDGCPVPTKWSPEQERKLAFEVARTLRSMGTVVSTIAYGVYYDEVFITKLMEAAGNSGIFRHISEIDDFGDAITEIRDVFLKTVPVEADLTFTPNAGVAGNVYKTTPDLLMAGTAGKASTRGFLDGKANFFVELSQGATTLHVAGTLNGEPVDEMLEITALTAEDEADFVRVLGAYAFLTGDRERAAELLDKTQDAGLAERAGSSWTQRENRETADMFRQMFRNRKFIGGGLKPSGPNHCVLNAIRVLVEDPGNVVYIPKGAYKRSGVLKVDPNVIENPHGRTLKVTGLQSKDDRFNFSLKTQKDVKVLPEGGGAPVDKKVWRNYNIILDGNLHLPELEATLSTESFTQLQEAGVIAEGEAYSPTRTYTLNLRNLKMISSAWANPRNLGLVNLLMEEAELEVEQTALNAHAKSFGATSTAREDDDVYIERGKTPEGIVPEMYSANCVEFRLMGYKTRTYDVSGLSLEEAKTRVQAVRQRLMHVRYLVRSITFAMEQTGSKVIPWGAPTTTSKGKTPKQEQHAEFGGAKLKRVTWTEECVCA
ncbi:MAG TPA: vWA domain-containing protein [Verrucomicrobiae bacterium]|nr:vWA domain-containing protein [Verrucomicrobiae bacterium]